MKIKGINDYKQFFEAVESCEGAVELVTDEGDCLNLKSRLSQFVSLANFFSMGSMPDIEIVVHEAADVERLRAYLQE